VSPESLMSRLYCLNRTPGWAETGSELRADGEITPPACLGATVPSPRATMGG
jgi:hypothetical protein